MRTRHLYDRTPRSHLYRQLALMGALAWAAWLGPAPGFAAAQDTPGAGAPIALVVAVDASLDVADLRLVQSALQSLLPLLQGTHEVALVAYDTVVQRVEPLTLVDESLAAIWQQGLARIEPAGRSNLAIALERGLDALPDDRPGHLLVFGQPRWQGASAEQSERFAQWAELLLLPRSVARGVSLTLVNPGEAGQVGDMVRLTGGGQLVSLQAGPELLETLQARVMQRPIGASTQTAASSSSPSAALVPDALTSNDAKSATEPPGSAAEPVNAAISATADNESRWSLGAWVSMGSLLAVAIGALVRWALRRRALAHSRAQPRADGLMADDTGLSSTYLPLHATTGKSFGKGGVHSTQGVPSSRFSQAGTGAGSHPGADARRAASAAGMAIDDLLNRTAHSDRFDRFDSFDSDLATAAPDAATVLAERAAPAATASSEPVDELEELRLITEQRQRHQPS